ncbi:hypothetical protein JCM16303_001123 [Sporobolomyces ruberrimus]
MSRLQQTRSRFFTTLRTLRPEKATISSASYSHHGVGPENFQRPDDMRALAQLLVDWSSLKSLTLKGYSAPLRSLGGYLITRSTGPEYRLDDLVLRDVQLPDISLMRLLGSSGLTSLTFESVTRIPNHVLKSAFEVLGPTLTHLSISNEDEDTIPLYEPEIFLPLVQLTEFELYMDESFPDTILGTLASLPSIYAVEIELSAVSYRVASAALENASPSLRSLALGGGESGELLWTDAQRWVFAKLCKARGVVLCLNGCDLEDIEDGKFDTRLSALVIAP